ncbi:GGDEF domain-containing protein [Echinimonas agarilytica]|uniref:diguanylate cyclase n=1 Tax=Echinimonas agarilytica TaxID=1215918 RepID=A0AA41W6T5_9GAMM|nr:GGDEF domain-containing protein [Echinimonas agarilytica]MCM2679757.1 GGDEF domain-containing protein [Echinimonas agarilytica]
MIHQSDRNNLISMSDETPAGIAGPRISLMMHCVAIGPVISLTIYHVFFGKPGVGLALACVCAILLFAICLLLARPESKAHQLIDGLFMFISLPVLLWSLTQENMYGIHLIAPSIFAAFIVLPVRLSSVLMAIYTPVAIAVYWHLNGPEEGIRVLFGLMCVYFFGFGLSHILVSMHRDMAYSAYIDTLTGAYNRNRLFDQLKLHLQSVRRGQSTVTLVLLDLDHFKAVNDEYGHAVGDDVLSWFAQTLMSFTREEDLLFRYGGEEFLLIIPGQNSDDCENTITKIRSRMKDAETPYGLDITFSAGVCEAQAAKMDLDTWIECADQALYQAKRDGRNCVRSWAQSD